MNSRQAEKKITALYERLSHDDELLGDSNSVVNQKAMLESYAAQTPGFFCKQDRPRYDLVYRKTAESAAIRRIADSDCPFVRLTEHPREDGSIYLFAINYNDRPEQARLTIDDKYDLESVWGGEMEKGVLSLRENSGALFILHSNEASGSD